MEEIKPILSSVLNFKYFSKNRDTYETIKDMMITFGMRDSFTLFHCYNVSKYCYSLSKNMGFKEEKCQEIKAAGMLHDIGKFGISLNILNKADRLTDKEYSAIKKHPVIGCSILEELNLSKTVMDGIKYHHKRHDLQGYPSFYNIKNLPIEAEIVGISDAFDAMTTNRPYKKGLSVEEAVEEIKENKGKQFHPDIANIMIEKVIKSLY